MTIPVPQHTSQEMLASQLIIYAQELNTIYQAANNRFIELEEVNRRLSELDTSKSNFVHLVSHELRTPVAVVTGYVEILSEMLAGRLEGREQNFLQTVFKQTEHLSNLVQQLTEYSQFVTEDASMQLPSVEAENDLAVILHTELAALDFSKVNPIELRVQIPTSMYMANIEPTRFRLIARYLLDNAVKFNSPNGWVSVNLNIQTVQIERNAPAPFLPHFEEEPQNLVLEIGNSGVGIPPNMLNVIFESFRQVENVTRRHQGGLGIGLTIVGRAVSSLSGQVQVRSDEAGTFFTVTLPYRSWENPAQLKQKLQEMESLVMRYAQDLRQLYNAEREKREQLAQANKRLNAVLTTLLAIQADQPDVRLLTITNLKNLCAALSDYLHNLAQTRHWEVDFASEVELSTITNEQPTVRPLEQALAQILFYAGCTILDGIALNTATTGVKVILAKTPPHLSLDVQQQVVTSLDDQTSNSRFVIDNVVTKLSGLVENLGGSCSYENLSDLGTIIKLAIPF